MAGRCSGDGLGTDSSGRLILLGPREGEWPNPGGVCALGDNNGVRIDPVSGMLWARDPRVIRRRWTYPGRTGSVTSPAPIDFHFFDESVVNAGCSDGVAFVSLSDGYARLRAETGNLWYVERGLVISVNGANVIATSGHVAQLDNATTGGVLGVGFSVESFGTSVPLPAGATLRVAAWYRLRMDAYNASGANQYGWRCPSLDVLVWNFDEAGS